MSKVRVKRKVPSGKVVLVERKKKPRIARCAICKKPLSGVPRKISSAMRKLPKSKRRPTRPFGGYLCASCTKEFFRRKARELGG